jgi:hypothetical protein
LQPSSRWFGYISERFNDCDILPTAFIFIRLAPTPSASPNLTYIKRGYSLSSHDTGCRSLRVFLIHRPYSHAFRVYPLVLSINTCLCFLEFLTAFTPLDWEGSLEIDSKLATLNLIFSMLAVFGITTPCQAQSNTKVQLDLIFLRNNTVYKPIYPFPIVFAIHNAALSWAFGTKFRWRLSKNGTDRYSDKLIPQWQIFDDGGYKPSGTLNSPTEGRATPSPSPFLFINSSAQIVNSTATVFLLEYSFGLWTNCSDMIAEREMDPEATPSTYNVDGEILPYPSKPTTRARPM